MKQTQDMEPEFFLNAIQNGGTFSQEYRSLYAQPDKLPDRESSDVFSGAAFEKGFNGEYGHRVFPRTGGDLVGDLLRAYTDEWIDTGIDPFDGQERPFSRKLTRTKTAFSKVKEYDFSHRPITVAWDDGLKRTPKTLSERLCVSAAEKAAASAAIAQPKPRTNTGPRAIKKKTAIQAVFARLSSKGALTTYRKLPFDVDRAAQIRAAGIFYALMESPWRYRLGRCKRCNDYFVLKVNPSRTPYVRGMHCPDCKNTASASASAKSRRQEREADLIALAVIAWQACDRVPCKGKERNECVAELVSEALGKKRAIQRNWVTRHEKEIRAAAKKSIHDKKA
jgi:hypothetical protein